MKTNSEIIIQCNLVKSTAGIYDKSDIEKCMREAVKEYRITLKKLINNLVFKDANNDLKIGYNQGITTVREIIGDV